MFVVCCVLCVLCCVVIVARSLFDVGCFVVCGVLLVVRRWMFVVCF